MLEQLTEIAHQLLRVFSATYNLMMFVLVFPTNKKCGTASGCSAFSFLILVGMVIGK